MLLTTLRCFRARQIQGWQIAGTFLVLVSLIVLPGCWVYSLNPLYDTSVSRDPDLVFDQSLIGTWSHLDGSCQWTLTVSTTPDSYQMTLAPGSGCSDDEKTNNYDAHLVRVTTHRFLDVAARSEQVCDLCLPLHSIFLLQQENVQQENVQQENLQQENGQPEKAQASDSLNLVPLDITWMTHALNSKRVVLSQLPRQRPARTAQVLTAGDAVYLTASSADLKKFAAKYADDKGAFRIDSDAVLKFKRK
jgi:hypothetical protein